MTQSSVRQIPWTRIGVESLAIVASILLAFFIDAWWDANRARSQERAILHDLRAELAINADRARRVAAFHALYGRRLTLLETMTDSAALSLPLDSAEAYIELGYAWQTFDPRTGTLDEITNSGRIELISNPETRRGLGDWRRRLSDVREEAALMTQGAERFLLRLTSYGPLPDTNLVRSNDRLLDVLNDRELMGLARAKVWYGEMYSGELTRHAAFADTILALLDGGN